MFILAQALGFVATAILLTYTLMKVSRKTIVVCLVIINALWGIHYLLLEAYTGAFCQMFTAAVVFVCYFKGKNRFFSSPAVPIIANALFIVIEIFTWAGYPTVIQAVGNFVFVLATWSDREITIKSLFIPLGLLWLWYNLIYMTWIGIICQVLAVSFNVIYVTKYLIQKKRAKAAQTEE